MTCSELPQKFALMLRYILLASIALVIGGCKAHPPVNAAEKKPDTTDIWVKKGQKERQALMRAVLRSWTKSHPDITKKDRPEEVKFTHIWDQHFEGGYIAYSAIEDEVIIFENSTKTSRRVSKSATLIDHARPGETINWGVVSSLLSNLDEPTKQKYKDLIRRPGYDEGIIGGIGTVYLRERLLDTLGKPIRKQGIIHDVLYAKGNTYEVFAGLRNSPGRVPWRV